MIFLRLTGKMDAPQMSRAPITNNQTPEQCPNQAVDLSIQKTENGQNIAQQIFKERHFLPKTPNDQQVTNQKFDGSHLKPKSRVSGNRHLKCPLCCKMFTWKGDMNKYLRAAQTGMKTITCPHCNDNINLHWKHIDKSQK